MSLSSARSKEPGIGAENEKALLDGRAYKGYKKPDSMVGFLKGVSLR